MTDGGKPDNPSRKRRRKRHKPQSRSESANSPPPQLPLPHPKRRKIEGPSTSKNQLGFLQKYHAGYQEQMVHWPQQPVNTIAKWLRNQSSLKVADFGCGNATLAKSVKNKVFSIDLVSNDPSVIACDMAHTPLDSSSVDVAVFCLSLMGTNYSNYLQEAKRVLKPSGWLLIAEVRSRFDPNTGGADPEKFFEAVSQLGFSLVSKDFSNKMFVLFYFKKAKKDSQVESIKWPELKPCIYKRR
nr:PREDICTED: ribosomal RNA-processing protein 8 isoform X3 [Musa acuminata subsp. malaccensis]